MSRILFITHSLWNGGAEKAVSVLCNALVKDGHEVGLFVYRPTKQDYHVEGEVKRFTLSLSYEEAQKNSLSRAVIRVKTIRKAIKEFKPDYCIPFLDTMVKETWVASIGLGIPVIATCRNKPDEKDIIGNKIRDFVFRRCKSLYLQTESQRVFFPKKIQKKAFPVNNAVDTRFLSAASDREYKDKFTKIINCGRLHKQKNQSLLIKAIAEVHKTHPEITLEIYGQGEDREKLQSLIESLKASSYITLKGYVVDTLQVLMDADMFVFTSDYEGSPNALIEAMATGMPVCSTDCPTGPAELIGRNNERGILTPINDVNAVVDAVTEMLDNPKKANELGRLAHKYVADNYSPGSISKQLIFEIESRL